MRHFTVTLKWAVALCLLFNGLEALFEPAYDDVLHEAYVPRDNGPPIFSAVGAVPPATMAELPPAQEDLQTKWMPGYWAWSPNNKNFIWITGAWRVPPPGMTWVPGEWLFFDTLGWAWLNGFWAQKPLSQLAPIDLAPEDPAQEKPGFPDSSNYFWNPGYWSFKSAEKKYEWMSGNWELLEASWILVPAHYEWRPSGYVFVPAYWDWPINLRGQAYHPVSVAKLSRDESFTPTVKLDDKQIYHALIVRYPDYLYLCHHIYHFHPERWATIAPTWWQWHSWWSLPWHNQWGLWWWYTHYGYPAPLGLTPDIAERIRSANPRLLQMTHELKPPFVIASKGALAPSAILSALYKGKELDKRVPILPSSPKAFEKIMEEAEKVARRPEKIEKLQREVEPSKRGKLHGVREADPGAFEEIAPKKDLIKVGLPSKPVLTPGQPQKAAVEHASEDLGVPQPQPKAANPNIEYIPLKELKAARGPSDSARKAKPKQISPPDPTIIHQPLPGSNRGPPVEPEAPQPHKAGMRPQEIDKRIF